tara:strand:- start:2213 stop:2320 length:108 start_codon:yes stop_codon:yes gene_type:complete
MINLAETFQMTFIMVVGVVMTTGMFMVMMNAMMED